MKIWFAALLIAGTAMAQLPPVPEVDPAAPAAMAEVDELSEVVVTGQRPVKDNGAIDGWLRRLIGRFQNTGTVSNLDSPLEVVSGTTECEGVGASGSVRCLMTLQSPRYETNFNPGALLLGIEIEDPKIRYMSVDDKGFAAGDSSELRGDSVRFRTACKATGVRICVATTRIAVKSRADDVHFQVDVVMEGIQTTHFDVTWKRRK